LFDWLAAQEDRHRERFESIYKTISAGKTWHDANTKLDKVSKPATLFSQAAREATAFKAGKDELNAVETAMQMEIKSRDYYKEHGAKSTSADASKFFAALAAEEHGHYLYLVDYKEYITDHADWFTRSEHHLLDGA
jgi:rubrerythrin